MPVNFIDKIRASFHEEVQLGGQERFQEERATKLGITVAEYQELLRKYSELPKKEQDFVIRCIILSYQTATQVHSLLAKFSKRNP